MSTSAFMAGTSEVRARRMTSRSDTDGPSGEESSDTDEPSGEESSDTDEPSGEESSDTAEPSGEESSDTAFTRARVSAVIFEAGNRIFCCGVGPTPYRSGGSARPCGEHRECAHR